MARTPFTSNHVPHMREDLMKVQHGVNAGGTRNRHFYLATNHSAFGLRAFKKLVDKGEVEIRVGTDGNVLARFVNFVPEEE